MKKLMFIAAAVAASVAVADITSANIVGYSNKETRQNYSIQVSQFDKVGEDGCDIQSIKPQGDSVGGGVFDLQTLDSLGCGGEEVFIYLTTADDVAKDGWYNSDGETFATRQFERGEGYIINNSSGADADVQFAGQVNLGESELAIRENYSIQGNFRPVAISIQDLVPVAPSGEIAVGGGNFDIQTLDSLGCGGEEIFIYLTTADDVAQDGWYNSDGETLATREFAPGEGFIINNSCGAEATIRYAAK